MHMRRSLIAPSLVSLAALFAVYLWGGAVAFIIAAALALLEITFSFDNAVINAKVLGKMSPHWQKRFLTWGMLISVAGVRLVLPILIISALTLASPIGIALLAFGDPAQYATLVSSAGPAIKAFGGAFLLLVALNYFFDTGKSVHWLSPVERRLVRWGEVESLEIAIALCVLVSIAFFTPDNALVILKSGIAGIILFIFTKGLADLLGAETEVMRSGAALFAYVSVLDAALSLDGVIGAFALTTLIPIIVVGLGIGAYFVRTLTLGLVHGRTLERFIYLEHGAHWAILGLALSMLAGLLIAVPEWFVASIGLFFIALAYGSSRREEVKLI
jgi:hypothetical protein